MPKFRSLDWSDWLYAIWGAFVGGGASAASSALVVALTDSGHYNLQTWAFYRLILCMFFANGLLGAFLLLKQKPVPSVVVERTETRTEFADPSATTIKKSETVTVNNTEE